MSGNGVTVWITGLPSAGKRAVANAVSKELEGRGYATEVIDSGKLRETMFDTLGFTKEDRDANVRRHAFLSKLLTRNGVIAVVSSVSPYRATRDAIREELGDFIEVWVATPKEVCVERDTRGHWAQALAGEIRGFTGVDDPYEPPARPEVVVDMAVQTGEEAARHVLIALQALGHVARTANAPYSDEEEAARQRLQDLGYVE